MTREEFIKKLEAALQGEVPAQVLAANVNYYRTYISEELSKGRREEDILDGLGDPRLIARTIIDAGGAGKAADNTYRNNEGDFQSGTAPKKINIKSWKFTLIIVLVLVMFILLISTVFRAVLSLLFSPFFWIVIIALVVFRGFLNRR